MNFMNFTFFGCQLAGTRVLSLFRSPSPYLRHQWCLLAVFALCWHCYASWPCSTVYIFLHLIKSSARTRFCTVIRPCPTTGRYKQRYWSVKTCCLFRRARVCARRSGTHQRWLRWRSTPRTMWSTTPMCQSVFLRGDVGSTRRCAARSIFFGFSKICPSCSPQRATMWSSRTTWFFATTLISCWRTCEPHRGTSWCRFPRNRFSRCLCATPIRRQYHNWQRRCWINFLTRQRWKTLLEQRSSPRPMLTHF